jgi:hypothetical protein
MIQPGGVYSKSPGPNVAENTGNIRLICATCSVESARIIDAILLLFTSVPGIAQSQTDCTGIIITTRLPVMHSLRDGKKSFSV